MNRKVAQIFNAYQSLVELQDKVNQIDENVTDINQRVSIPNLQKMIYVVKFFRVFHFLKLFSVQLEVME